MTMAVLIIFPVILQAVIFNLIMLSIKGHGEVNKTKAKAHL